jgi:hypothetical protein
MDAPADGLFEVLKTNGYTLAIRQGEETVSVSSDLFTAAPTTWDTRPPSTAVAENRENNRTPPDDAAEQEYVIEKFFGARQLQDGSLRYRIRWYGYAREYDTWEPAHYLPPEMLRRYLKRTRLPQPKKSPIWSRPG